jgi:hypothetical protein
VLHRLNLPAATDVTRLLNEIGELKRQVRKLSEQLAASEQRAQRSASASTSRPATKRAPRKGSTRGRAAG